jgi:hypothetical protein
MLDHPDSRGVIRQKGGIMPSNTMLNRQTFWIKPQNGGLIQKNTD